MITIIAIIFNIISWLINMKTERKYDAIMTFMAINISIALAESTFKIFYGNYTRWTFQDFNNPQSWDLLESSGTLVHIFMTIGISYLIFFALPRTIMRGLRPKMERFNENKWIRLKNIFKEGEIKNGLIKFFDFLLRYDLLWRKRNDSYNYSNMIKETIIEMPIIFNTILCFFISNVDSYFSLIITIIMITGIMSTILFVATTMKMSYADMNKILRESELRENGDSIK